MYRVLIAPEFKISAANPDFPLDILDALIEAKKVTGSNYVSFWAEISDGEIKSNIVVTTYPAAWLQEYTDRNYSRIDPVIQKGLSSVGAVIFDHENPEDQSLAPLAEGALRQGIGRFTVGIPAHLASNIRSVTTFATDIDVSDDPDEQGATLTKCREQAHILGLAVVERFLKKNAPAFNLTERELEVLFWGSKGKTDQQIADLMGISRWTVIAHTQSAKSKLRVSNKAAAIARALELQLLKIFDPKL